MSAKLKACPFCERPEFLWGGDTCDVCDADNDGTLDRYQGDARFDQRALNAPPHPQVVSQAEWRPHETVIGYDPHAQKVTVNTHTPEREAEARRQIRRLNGLEP